jgi:hypothetical protein
VDGLNLYAYVGNNPVGGLDPWGLQFFPPIIFVGPEETSVPELGPHRPRNPRQPSVNLDPVGCASTALEYRRKGMQRLKEGSSDTWVHCWASCMIARKHSKWCAMAVGIGREMRQMLLRFPLVWEADKTLQEYAKDMHANLIGIEYASDPDSCECACDRSFERGR